MWDFQDSFGFGRGERSGDYVTDDKDESGWKDHVRNKTNYFKTTSKTIEK